MGKPLDTVGRKVCSPGKPGNAGWCRRGRETLLWAAGRGLEDACISYGGKVWKLVLFVWLKFGMPQLVWFVMLPLEHRIGFFFLHVLPTSCPFREVSESRFSW